MDVVELELVEGALRHGEGGDKGDEKGEGKDFFHNNVFVCVDY